MSDPPNRDGVLDAAALHEVCDPLAEAVFSLDEELRFTFLNDRAETLLQGTEDDLLGTVVWEAVPDPMTATFRRAFEQAAAAREPATFEEHDSARDTWFEVGVYPSATGLTVSLHDVTEYVHRREELERRERALRRAYEVVADTDRPFTEQIDVLLSLVREVVGTDYATFSYVDDPEYVFEAVDVPDGVDLQRGTTVPLEELPNCRHVAETARTLVLEDVEADAPELADPTWGIACYLGAPVFSGEEVYGTFCFYGMEAKVETFSDWEVTFVELLSNWVSYELGRQRQTRELEASNERLEQFAYAASHDLQEPLRMVSSYLRLIETRYADALDEDGREFLEFAVDGADRMREMIDSLLAYSRIDTRGDPFEPVDLNAVLDDVRTDLQFRIDEGDADVASDDLPRVEGDPNQLRQLVQNLLDNALEYSGEESASVDVSAERAGSKWVVSVHDEGVGIDPDDQDRIFEVFQRLTTRQEHAGTGIGLALCERIVERHDGELWVESTSGEGSTFSFTLPAASEQ